MQFTIVISIWTPTSLHRLLKYYKNGISPTILCIRYSNTALYTLVSHKGIKVAAPCTWRYATSTPTIEYEQANIANIARKPVRHDHLGARIWKTNGGPPKIQTSSTNLISTQRAQFVPYYLAMSFFSDSTPVWELSSGQAKLGCA